MQSKILIVEDEPAIVTLISNRLDKDRYEVSIAMDGEEALHLIKTKDFDLVSLDIMLPKVDGLTLCSEVRKKNKKTLIMIISALDLDDRKERAYSLGADDYIAKPFSPKLLSLKIDSLLKRRFELTNTQLEYKKIIQHDSIKQIFYINRQQLSFTPSEYMIFETLFNNANQIFSKDDLAQILYNNDIGNIDRDGIRTHIYILRKKIMQLTEEDIIKTIRGIGFKFNEN